MLVVSQGRSCSRRGRPGGSLKAFRAPLFLVSGSGTVVFHHQPTPPRLRMNRPLPCQPRQFRREAKSFPRREIRGKAKETEKDTIQICLQPPKKRSRKYRSKPQWGKKTSAQEVNPSRGKYTREVNAEVHLTAGIQRAGPAGLRCDGPRPPTTSAATNLQVTPFCFALASARAMAEGEMSTPVTSNPRLAR